MRLDLDWLAEFVGLPPEDELVERLSLGGFEDVFVDQLGPDLSAVRVGHVLERSAHPQADRLSVCRVEIGADEPVTIVCGAPNVAAGQKVAVASPGTKLPDGTKLKRAKIRGVVSLGMICSRRELGLGDEHEGILVLDPDAPVGAPLPEVVRTGTRVLEVGITPNRGDTASLLGLAREVRALFGGELTLPESSPPEADPAAADSVSVEIEAPEACHRYTARVVRGVRVGPSPPWVQARLEASGIRAINCVVDVTNLALLEFGQPLHAFDLARVTSGRVKVRFAVAGEKLTTLDGETRDLHERDLLIADAKRPIALAGVMGGVDSEVGDATTDILIESAHFDPATVRLGARRHGLHTEASYRFERGVDRDGVGRAADRAARLLAELAGGEVATGCVESFGAAPIATETVRLDIERMNRLLGTGLAPEEAEAQLARLGIRCRATGDPGEASEGRGAVLEATIPSHRNDLHTREDLCEEVARIYGYDRIPATVPQAPIESVREPRSWTLTEAVRDALVGAGLDECVSLPFLAPDEIAKLRLEEGDPRGEPLRVLNPIREEEPCLRSLLLPSLLRIARQNRSRQVDRVQIFEVSRVFRPLPGAPRPEEPLELAVLLTAAEERGLWEAEPPPPLFFRAKGIAERLLNQLGYVASFRGGAVRTYLHPGAAAAIEVDSRVIGAIGELHPELTGSLGIGVPSALVEIELDVLAALPSPALRVSEVSRFPQVRRDLAVVLDRSRPAGEVLAAVRKSAGGDLLSVEIFDRYEGSGVPEGKVSLAFRLVFQRNDRTLRDAEVASATDRVVRMLSHRFAGTLR